MDRQSYIDKLSAQLKQWDAEIRKIEAKVQQAQAATKGEYTKQVKELRSKRDAAQNKLRQIQQAHEGAWEELKSGAEKAFDEMKNAVDNAISKFK